MPEDDPTIGDDEYVWRRVPRDSVKYESGPPRASSGAFNDSSDGTPMSVDLALLAPSPEWSLGNCDGGLVRIKVGDLRAGGFGVTRHPLEDNPAHCYVTGRKSTGKRQKIAKMSEWVINPPEHPPDY